MRQEGGGAVHSARARAVWPLAPGHSGRAFWAGLPPSVGSWDVLFLPPQQGVGLWGARASSCIPRVSAEAGWRKCQGGGSWEGRWLSVPSLLCLALKLNRVVPRCDPHLGAVPRAGFKLRQTLASPRGCLPKLTWGLSEVTQVALLVERTWGANVELLEGTGVGGLGSRGEADTEPDPARPPSGPLLTRTASLGFAGCGAWWASFPGSLLPGVGDGQEPCGGTRGVAAGRLGKALRA